MNTKNGGSQMSGEEQGSAGPHVGNPFLLVTRNAARALELLNPEGQLKFLDSLSVIDLLTEIQHQAQIELGADQIPSDFSSVEAIAQGLNDAFPDYRPAPEAAPAEDAAGGALERVALFSKHWRERRQPACITNFDRTKFKLFERADFQINNFEQHDKGRVAQVARTGFQIMKELDLHWWMAAGSALGFHRDHGFIPWDTDIDVEVWFDIPGPARVHMEKLLVEAFSLKEMRLVRALRDERDNRLMQLLFASPDSIHFDIFFFYRDRDNLLNEWDYLYNYGDGGVSLLMPHLFQNLTKAIFCDAEVNLPNPIEAYLVYLYGEGWRVPVRKDRLWWSLGANLIRM